jgi:hypothetical protein
MAFIGVPPEAPYHGEVPPVATDLKAVVAHGVGFDVSRFAVGHIGRPGRRVRDARFRVP